MKALVVLFAIQYPRHYRNVSDITDELFEYVEIGLYEYADCGKNRDRFVTFDEPSLLILRPIYKGYGGAHKKRLWR
jgi:hypothetical protein